MASPADGPANATATRSGAGERLRARVAEAEAAIERLLEGWSVSFAARGATDGDRALAGSIRAEARPAASALHFAQLTQAALDESTLAHHEALAMLTLLGRRLALLGLSPASTGHAVPALAEAWKASAPPLPEALRDALGAAFVEGFVRGHGERARGEWLDALQRAQPFLSPVTGVRLWVAVGDLDAARLAAGGEAFARDVHRRDARAAIVDLRALRAPSPRRRAALADTFEALAMLGVARGLLAAPAWREELADPDLRVADTLAEALRALPRRPRLRVPGFARRGGSSPSSAT